MRSTPSDALVPNTTLVNFSRSDGAVQRAIFLVDASELGTLEALLANDTHAIAAHAAAAGVVWEALVPLANRHGGRRRLMPASAVAGGWAASHVSSATSGSAALAARIGARVPQTASNAVSYPAASVNPAAALPVSFYSAFTAGDPRETGTPYNIGFDAHAVHGLEASVSRAGRFLQPLALLPFRPRAFLASPRAETIVAWRAVERREHSSSASAKAGRARPGLPPRHGVRARASWWPPRRPGRWRGTT